MPSNATLTPSRVTLVLLLAVLAWDASGLDLTLALAAGGVNGFPLRRHWLLAQVLHQGGRYAAWATAFWIGLSVWRPAGVLSRLEPARRRQLALSCLVGILLVSAFKVMSTTSCPWDLSIFGGTAPWVSHWAWGTGDGGGGHCFPAGHASSGFAFVGGHFVFRDRSPAVARAWLCTAVGAGFAFGLAQQWRGAHFMSHTLWTAWLCWAAAHMLDILRRRLPSADAADAAEGAER